MSDVTRLNEALAGRYRIERRLGDGGMATVYLADDLRHERQVALKVLKPELAAVVGVERFLAEIKTTANLQHPHILPLFDSGEAGGFVFYVMPYAEGENLRQRLDREAQLPIDEALRIATNVAEALNYAHSRGVLHRDIKPANILLLAGKPVIADFGIALAMDAGGGRGRLTETGLSLGTPQYMSPEQATGAPHVGSATDTYSLGCVLYEMLAGTPPFTGATAHATFARIIAGEAEPVTAQRKAVPDNVGAALRKALEKLPADRFRSAGDFAKALSDPGFRNGESARDLRAHLNRAPAPLVVAWALASTVLLLVTTGVLVLRSRNADALPWHMSINLSSSESLASAAGNVIALSPDGRTLAYVAATGPTQIYLRPLDRFTATALAGTEGARDPFFSPDGEWIGFFTDTQLKRARVTGGVVETLVESMPSRGMGATWIEDGSILFGSRRDGILRVSESGGIPARVIGPDSASGDVWYVRPVLAGDGDVLLFTRSAGGTPDTKAVVAVSLRSGERRVLAQDAYDIRTARSGEVVYTTVDGLMTQGFDPSVLALTGAPIRVLEGVRMRPRSDVADYTLSRSGLVAWLPAVSGPPDTLVWIDRNGSSTAIRHVGPHVNVLTLSPTDDRAAITITTQSETGIWMVDLERATLSPLDRDPDANHLAVWTHGGTRVVFSSRRTGGPDLYWRPADGSGRAEVYYASPFHKDGGSWHEASGLFAFAEQRSPNGWDVWIHSADSTPAAWPLLQSRANETHPMISPNGTWLAFVSDRTGRNEVNLTPFPAGGSITQVSSDGGNQPLWSRDGNELYYQVGDSLMVVDMTGISDLRPGRPRLLFRARFAEPGSFGAPNYGVTKSGDRFLMIRRSLSDQAQTEVRVIGDFLQELRRRLDTN